MEVQHGLVGAGMQGTVQGAHSIFRMHWDHEPNPRGRAALPRRPNLRRHEHSDVPVHERTDTPFVPRWTRVLEKWDARQRVPTQ